ncbi:MAG: bifunctional adenosylcobinamide kinase/adenosylcobinamide-phosphate guanylyltransferase [Thermodesulfobacteriota bacterium]
MDGTGKVGLIFVAGGARSGKSSFAELLASRAPGKKLYIATARPLDPEMAERIDAHRARRGALWETVEAPDDPAGALRDAGGYGAVLIDCLTLWLSNRMEAGLSDGDLLGEARALARAARECRALVVAVSNEVGLGIVPDNPLARRFRDLAGLVNQAFAAEADEAYLTASGIPLRLK